MADCSSSIGASVTLLCPRDQPQRIAATLRRRETHCGWSAPKVGWHCGHSRAGVKGHCGSCHATVEGQNRRVKSIRAGQRSPFCVCVLLLYRLFMRAVFVCGNSADSGLSQPWDQQFGLFRRQRQSSARGVRGQTVWILLLCPFCAHVVASIAEWKRPCPNRKVLK